MKKSFVMLVVGVMAMMFGACDKVSETTIDQLGIYPLVDHMAVVYADQPSDTFQIVSNKKWRAVVDADWASLPPSSTGQDVLKENQIYIFPCQIDFQPNITGKVRYVQLKVDNEDHHDVGRIYMQAYWHNISYPVASFRQVDGDWDYNSASFVLTVPAFPANPVEIEFTIYKSATLTSSADWIGLNKTEFGKGSYVQVLDLMPNDTGGERQATIVLTTEDGISTPIQVVQNK